MRKNIFKTVGAVLAAVLVISYIAVQIANAVSRYDTEMAVMYTAYESISCDAFIIRDEQIIPGSDGGVIRYLLRDGEKVSKNGTVAELYSSEDAVYAKERAEELTERISSLKESEAQAKSSGTSLETVDRLASDALIKMLNAFDGGNMDDAYDLAEDYLDFVTRRQIITGVSSGYGDMIAELQAELDGLNASSARPSSTVTSASSGYFVKDIDGYENAFDIDELSSITAQQLDSAAADAGLADGSVGKVVSDYDWYAAVKLDSETAMLLTEGQQLSVDFDVESAETVPATVKYINRGDDGVVAVLSCNYMDSALAHARRLTARIVLGRHSGLKISTSAIRVKDGVKGVYVSNGYTVKFKTVDILYTGDGYTICRKTDDGSSVALYDEVITKGRDLYDGKIIA